MAGPESRLKTWWTAFRATRHTDPAGYRLRLGLGLVLFGLGLIVALGNPGEGVPERLAEGKTLRAIDYWRTYGWAVAVGNIVLLALALRFVPLWQQRGPAAETPALAPPPGGPGLPFVVAVALAVVCAGALASQRLSYSFWEDEAYSIEHAIDGAYRFDDGELEFEPVRLRDTLWYYYIPNNHVVHSILARGTLGIWQAVAGPDERRVGEAAARLPAFLAGMGSVAALALLLWRIGFAGAGVFAAWLLALHPWQLRFGSEARGYSLALLLAPVCLILLMDVLHRGTWRRWAAFGIAQFLLLWNLPTLMYQVAVTNVVAAIAVGLHQRGTPDLRQQWTRWAVVNAFGAMAFLQLMIPNLAQLPAYLERTLGRRDLDQRFVQSVASHLFGGLTWKWPAQRGADPHYPELFDVAAASPVLVWSLIAVATGAAVIGLLRLLAARDARVGLAAILVLPGPLTYALAVMQQQNIFPWYLCFMLPSLAALVGIGFVTAFGWLPARARPFATGGAMLAFLVPWFVITQHPRQLLLDGPVKPGRESARLTRTSLDPMAPENQKIVTIRFCDQPIYDDPLQRQAETPEALQREMDAVDAGGQTLFVNVGRPARLRGVCPEVLEFVEQHPAFEQLAFLHGFEPQWTRMVYRYSGRATSGAGSPAASSPTRGGWRQRTSSFLAEAPPLDPSSTPGRKRWRGSEAPVPYTAPRSVAPAVPPS